MLSSHQQGFVNIFVTQFFATTSESGPHTWMAGTFKRKRKIAPDWWQISMSKMELTVSICILILL